MNNLETPAVTNRFDRSNALVAFGVWLTALVLYVLTVAPTLSFWDAGEFIAVSSILGVPHPPGSPLYVLLGRIFSILPLASDPALRVNLLSSVSSAFAAMFAYLIVVRLLRSWFTERTTSNLLIVYGGGVSGALFAAFGFTAWNNAVEAEVYGLTMLLMLGIVWLGLLYREREGTPFADRLMLLAVFIAVMGVGVHLMAFVALPVVALFFMLKRGTPTWAWFAIAIFVVLELYLVFALSSRPGEISYYIPVAIAAAFYFLYIFSFEQVPRLHLYLGLGFLLSLLPLFGDLITRAAGSAPVGALTAVGLMAFALLNLAALWIALSYSKNSGAEDSARTYLAPAGFVAAATVFVLLLYVFKGHQAFLLVSAILAVAIGWALRKFIRWDILIAIVAVTAIIIEIKPFLLALGIAALALTLLGFARMLPGWKSALLILAAAVLGFSINIFIPVRAQQEPAINENNPQTISKTIDFLDRKQYGQISMVERMFTRRAQWENQFGNHERMGFWGFFHEQYGLKGPGSVFIILIGLFGAWEIVRRSPRRGIPLVLLLMLTTVGLVLYMNFADGTRQVGGLDYLEVRDRDYFFTAGFVLFGLAIGLGLAFLVAAIRDAARTLGRPVLTALTAASLLLFAAPVIAVVGNYHTVDRAGNFIPYDYGMNLFNSAEPDAILFTHGDNDTFPLWALQQTYGRRPDVAVVNLSLSNTDWYVKQLRSEMGLELPWTDKEIEALRPHRLANGTWYRLQDMVTDALIDRYLGERPIYFSVTVGAGARTYQGRPIDERLTMAGMLFRVGEPHGRINVDVEQSLDFFLEGGFQARGVADPDVYKDEATFRLTRNYGNAFLMVADTLRRTGQVERAEELVQHGWELVPYASDLPEFLASLFSEQGRVDDLTILIDTADYGDKNWMRTLLARAYTARGDTAQARQILESIVRESGSYRNAFDELLRMNFAARDVEGMKQAMRLWLEHNPNDQQIAGALRELERGRSFEELIGESP